LAILNVRVASPSELAEQLDRSVPDVSYHVKVLREEDYIEMVRTEPRRGSVEHFYRATRRSLIAPAALEKMPPSVQHGISRGILQNLFDDSSAALEAGTLDAHPDSHASWTPVVLDSQGFGEMASLFESTLERIFDLEAESAARLLAKEPDQKDAIVTTAALLGFESTRSMRDAKKARRAKRKA
jgi:DNA-binding MarR family transcriptional regulator